jgi:hypothetical protein
MLDSPARRKARLKLIEPQYEDTIQNIWGDWKDCQNRKAQRRSIPHQFNLNTSLSKAFTASCVARVELAEYATRGSVPTQLSP